MQQQEGIAYLRVSSADQGRSGLGLEAQEYNVAKVARERGIVIVAKVFEVESGWNNDRPKFLKTLRRCKRERKWLIIANMSRLGRDMFFVASILCSGVKYIAANKPDAGDHEHMQDAIYYDKEGRNIRKNTKDGIQSRLRRGLKMGESIALVQMETRYRTQKYARQMRHRIEGYEREEGRTLTQRDLMKIFIRKQVRTFRGRKKWIPSLVHHLLRNIKALADATSQESYTILFRYISFITEDDNQTQAIMNQHYAAIVEEASRTKGSLLEDFGLMLSRAKEIVLNVVKDKPFPHGRHRLGQTAFFPLSPQMTVDHADIFCFKFYHNKSEQEIADQMRLPIEKTRVRLKQVLYDLSRRPFIPVDHITDL